MPNRLMNLDGTKPIMENWDDLNEGFANAEAELDAAAAVSEGIQAEVTAHKDSTAAHAAEHIAYTGPVAGAGNLKAAVDSVQEQLNTAVVSGDSSPAADQARISSTGTTYPSLKSRLDTERSELSAQLADTAVQKVQQLTYPDRPVGVSLSKKGVVIGKGTSGQWDDGAVESPMVWWDRIYQRWGMVYVGYQADPGGPISPQIGLAWSSDLVNWVKDSNNPIFGFSGVIGTPDRYGVTGPYIWYEDGTYYLYYIGLDAEGYEAGVKRLCLATSNNLYAWTRYSGNPIISPAGSGWRAQAIWHPNVIKYNSLYYMFINATDYRGHEVIGYGMSPNLVDWTMDDANSPILDIGVAGSWESQNVGDPCVYKIGDTWYMAYYGVNATGTIHAQEGLAWANDGDFPKIWHKVNTNPVLTNGASGSYDAVHAHKPYVVSTPLAYYRFYTAVDDLANRTIALATEEKVSAKRSQTIQLRELLRTTSSTTPVTAEESTVLFDSRGLKDLEVRLIIRGKCDVPGDTLTVSLLGYTIPENTLTTNEYSNLFTGWAPASSTGVFYSYAQFKSSTGNPVNIGNIAVEFRWVDS